MVKSVQIRIDRLGKLVTVACAGESSRAKSAEAAEAADRRRGVAEVSDRALAVTLQFLVMCTRIRGVLSDAHLGERCF